MQFFGMCWLSDLLMSVMLIRMRKFNVSIFRVGCLLMKLLIVLVNVSIMFNVMIMVMIIIQRCLVMLMVVMMELREKMMLRRRICVIMVVNEVVLLGLVWLFLFLSFLCILMMFLLIRKSLLMSRMRFLFEIGVLRMGMVNSVVVRFMSYEMLYRSRMWVMSVSERLSLWVLGC